MGAMAILVDSSRCTGCKSCQSACKSWNALPSVKNEFFTGSELTHPVELSAESWTKVLFRNPSLSGSRPVWDMVHMHCMHCNNAACLNACPARAIYREGSWVVIDHRRCIGCGTCEKACPYGAVHVAKNAGNSIKKNKAYKCHGCAAEPRETPACVAACPNQALVYDYRIKLIKNGLKRVKDIQKKFPDAALYGLNESGGLNVLTIFKQKPETNSFTGNGDLKQSGRVKDLRFLYAAISPLACGIESVKREMFRIADALVSKEKS